MNLDGQLKIKTGKFFTYLTFEFSVFDIRSKLENCLDTLIISSPKISGSLISYIDDLLKKVHLNNSIRGFDYLNNLLIIKLEFQMRTENYIFIRKGLSRKLSDRTNLDFINIILFNPLAADLNESTIKKVSLKPDWESSNLENCIIFKLHKLDLNEKNLRILQRILVTPIMRDSEAKIKQFTNLGLLTYTIKTLIDENFKIKWIKKK